jgi:ribonuclease HII
MPRFANHVESLSYMAIHKLGEALDVRDSNRFTKQQRESMFASLTADAEALVFAVQQLGTDQQHQELLERMQHTQEVHAKYLQQEKDIKALRKARKAEGSFYTCPKCQFTYNKAGVVVMSPGAGHAACQSHLMERAR